MFFWLPEKANKPLVGVIEMGGASVQIAFVPADDVTGHLFPVHVTNRRYLLYAQSYLDYGETSVVDYVKTRLEASDPASIVIHNPCMLRGINVTLNSDAAYSRLVS